MGQTARSSDTPTRVPDDQLTLNEAVEARSAKPDTPEGHVATALTLMSTSGPAAEASYRASLEALAGSAAAVVEAVSARYADAPEEEYVDRWALVQLLTDLRKPEALSGLEQILSMPVPPERTPGMVIHSSVSEEVVIRTTAIEGIVRLAVEGNEGALGALRKPMQSEFLSIRRAAIQGFLEAAGEDARERLRSELPERDHFLIDLRREDVRSVPQAQPEPAKRKADDPVPSPRLMPPWTDK